MRNRILCRVPHPTEKSSVKCLRLPDHDGDHRGSSGGRTYHWPQDVDPGAVASVPEEMEEPVPAPPPPPRNWQATGPWLKRTTTPGPGYWLARYTVGDGGVVETPVQIRSGPVTSDLFVFGFSSAPEWGPTGYHTWVVRFAEWMQARPDAVFLPDRDRTQDAPEPQIIHTSEPMSEKKPDYTRAREVLRAQAKELQQRARALVAESDALLDAANALEPK